MNRFKAPWGKLLWVMSAIGTAICLAISLFFLRAIPALCVHTADFWLGVLPLSFIAAAICFIIRGYSVSGDSILVERLFWSTRLPLAGLQSVQFLPGAMRGSIRTFGNGGFFSFTGRYRNKLLGSYQAFVTDSKHSVVLRFPKRTVVLSPDPPEDFVQLLAPYAGNA
jgi:hypothetical protein